MKIHGVKFSSDGTTYSLSFDDQKEVIYFVNPSTKCFCNSIRTSDPYDNGEPVWVDITINKDCPWHTSWHEVIKDRGVDKWESPPDFLPQPFLKAERFPVIPTVMR